jgi:hypothetical protein
MKYKTIEYLGVTLEIEYLQSEFIPATRMDPEEGGEIEIEGIYAIGSQENIIELLEAHLIAIEECL